MTDLSKLIEAPPQRIVSQRQETLTGYSMEFQNGRGPTGEDTQILALVAADGSHVVLYPMDRMLAAQCRAKWDRLVNNGRPAA